MRLKSSKGYNWRFFKAGGAYQPLIERGSDIAAVGELDMKLWAALSCPTRGLYFDEKTLDFMDADKDGRIRRDDVVAACEFACAALKNPDTLAEGADSLKLSDIDENSVSGKRLLGCAAEVLKNIGKAGADSIAVSDFDDKSKIFAKTPFNADGIITELSCEGDSGLIDVLKLAIKTCGAKIDRSGLEGVDAQTIDDFFSQRAEFLKWLDIPRTDGSVLPFGDETPKAYAAYAALAEKIDDYFTRTAVASFGPEAEAAVNAQISQIESIFAKYGDNSQVRESLKALPLAKVGGGVLDFHCGVNPAYERELLDFSELCVKPILKTKESLDSKGWAEIKKVFEPRANWFAACPKTAVSEIDEDVLRGVPEAAREKLLELVEKDVSIREHVDNVDELEKLVRYNKNLLELLRNFVNFEEFYSDAPAIFQYGRLFIDSRDCGLCIRVDDVSKHASLAAASYGYLIYCTCRRMGEADINIVAVVTAGDSDNLVVGRNGVFYDRAGRDWDASVVKIIHNPVSLMQAFWSPYKRAIKWFSEQVAKYTSTADTKVVENLTESVLPPKASTKVEIKKIDVGTVAALGVAVGGITTAFGIILDSFLHLGYWIPLGIVGVVLAISLPSMVVAALKLRIRSLAPLLDANGWAVNGKAAISVLFGGKLTKVASVPLTVRRSLRKSRDLKILFAAIILAILSVAAALAYKKYGAVKSVSGAEGAATAVSAATTSQNATPAASATFAESKKQQNAIPAESAKQNAATATPAASAK